MVGVGFNAYRRTDVITADPKKLVIMCYEGAVHSLKLAKAKYYAKEYEAKAKAIQNSLDIVTELRSALNFEQGGEIAKNLDALYSFWMKLILKADLEEDPRGLDQVAAMMEEIKSALEEAYYNQKEGQTLPLPLGNPSRQKTPEAKASYPPEFPR